MFDLGDIFAGFIFITFIMLWWNAQGVKQTALIATKAHCKHLNVQLLDDGLALKGFWFKRNQHGNLTLWRCYNFEFTSTGNERYSGQIIMLGRLVEKIRMDAYRIN